MKCQQTMYVHEFEGNRMVMNAFTIHNEPIERCFLMNADGFYLRTRYASLRPSLFNYQNYFFSAESCIYLIGLLLCCVLQRAALIVRCMMNKWHIINK